VQTLQGCYEFLATSRLDGIRPNGFSSVSPSAHAFPPGCLRLPSSGVDCIPYLPALPILEIGLRRHGQLVHVSVVVLPFVSSGLWRSLVVVCRFWPFLRLPWHNAGRESFCSTSHGGVSLRYQSNNHEGLRAACRWKERNSDCLVCVYRGHLVGALFRQRLPS
jgi:hypothetical protein